MVVSTSELLLILMTQHKLGQSFQTLLPSAVCIRCESQLLYITHKGDIVNLECTDETFGSVGFASWFDLNPKCLMHKELPPPFGLMVSGSVEQNGSQDRPSTDMEKQSSSPLCPNQISTTETRDEGDSLRNYPDTDINMGYSLKIGRLWWSFYQGYTSTNWTDKAPFISLAQKEMQ